MEEISKYKKFKSLNAFNEAISKHRDKHSKLNGTDKHILRYLSQKASYKCGVISIYRETIAKDCDVSLRTLDRTIKKFKDLQILEVKRRTNGKKQLSPIFIFLPYVEESTGFGELSEYGNLESLKKPVLTLVTEPVQTKLFNLWEGEYGNLGGDLGGDLDNQDETYSRNSLHLVSDNSPKVLTKNLINKQDTIKEISKKDDDSIKKYMEFKSNKYSHNRYGELSETDKEKIEFDVYVGSGLNKNDFKHVLEDVKKEINNKHSKGEDVKDYENYLMGACKKFRENFVQKAIDEKRYKELMLEAVGESPNAFDDRNKEQEQEIDYTDLF
ncbi:hypothetical protein [Listeria monocytogenes]|uniref:hypothetical protein n=2 Tax=Listeria monocytogenes TaxID=1639 RepID=UPI00183468DE|nr:hypothetical protein [Listeria monocytogenes]MDN7308557.1 hypothetical protein [Listeria monocytogenes]MDN7313676.1 hypothetical protein [Listeria monocytogenes]HAC2798927.1 hypothetical protein [Listeria monocytogenes]